MILVSIIFLTDLGKLDILKEALFDLISTLNLGTVCQNTNL
jgi:hypothetical protein